MDKSLTGITEMVTDDIAEIERNRAGGCAARNVRSLEDYTLHDLVRVTEIAQGEGYSVELVTHDGKVFWGLIDRSGGL